MQQRRQLENKTQKEIESIIKIKGTIKFPLNKLLIKIKKLWKKKKQELM